jgi:hypothetical protein
VIFVRINASADSAAVVRAAVALFWFLAQSTLVLISRHWSQIPFPFPLDYGEGR